MPWGLTVLTFVAGSYIVSDPLCESLPVEIPCYYFDRFFLSEVPRYYRVVTALGYLSLKGFVFGNEQSILIV